ncbi:methyltransferase domain-containing protein [Hwangdonia lutea]|uniref:Methyltransferase domain-containing protein n=1 Tax=Hwangdonia lutea TaxID=3075823 RepID=A0AA97HQQ3_9FLAO|nr:methyltransferase domain-containing protein [Hwangdonia sp. SCSIO 19198]WOD42988.1 methyltransferase domain-containing protein [Hwangdonia sp. SCSIO 19198]
MNLTEEFWDNKYKTNDIGWDLGTVSPPIKAYIDQLSKNDKELKILIPGGGHGYEAEYLNSKGFKNVYVVDVSETALSNLKNRVPSFPSSHLIKKNFFELDMTFDLIIEQTFFCAINPKHRALYAEKASKILHTNGKIIGLLFNVPLNKTHPPFGGNKEEYLTYFKPYFHIGLMEKATNSHESRSGKELFFNIQKK